MEHELLDPDPAPGGPEELRLVVPQPPQVLPRHAHEVERRIDVVEEVARRVGFNQIPRTLPHTTEPDEVAA